jgi:hypothetical protein
LFKLDVNIQISNSNQLEFVQINSARKQTNAEIASRNITRMVLFLLLFYYFGYLPYMISHFWYYSIKTRTVEYMYVAYFAIFCKDLAKSSTIFIFFYFNKEYKKKLKLCFKKIIRR